MKRNLDANDLNTDFEVLRSFTKRSKKERHKSLERVNSRWATRVTSIETNWTVPREETPTRNSFSDPTGGHAILSTEIVPSDFTCSVSSLGQSSLHYRPADVSLRQLQLAGLHAHSWTERIQIVHECTEDCGKARRAISALRFAFR
jgi:hypothetical protein